MGLAVIFIVVMFLIDALIAKFVIQQFATLFLTSTTMCIFFAPKVRTLLKYNDMEIMQKYTEEKARSWQSRMGKQPSGTTPDYASNSNKPSTGQKPSTTGT
jgi:nitrogen fixation/metabolism regulation signal transduction histidine kinase